MADASISRHAFTDRIDEKERPRGGAHVLFEERDETIEALSDLPSDAVQALERGRSRLGLVERDRLTREVSVNVLEQVPHVVLHIRLEDLRDVVATSMQGRSPRSHRLFVDAHENRG
ncbi:MAG: hypothetical protein ACHREM_20805 [Polyangiales bacterium]